MFEPQQTSSETYPVTRRTRRFVSLLIVLSLVISLIPTSLDYLDISLRLTTDLTEGSRLRQFQLLSLFALAAGLLYTHRSIALASFRHVNPFLLLVALYCLASMLWSPFPMVTLKRAIILLGLMVVSLSIVPPMGGAQQLPRVLLYTLTTILVLSLGAVVLAPHIGIDRSLGGAWRGITWQKNLLGSAAGYATLLWLHEWTRKELPRAACTTGVLFSLFMLMMSQSATATLLTALACAVYLYWHRRWLQDSYANQIILLGGAAVAILVVHLHYVWTGQMPTWTTITSPIAALFDKGSDLTGRTDIWHMLMLSIQQHPILGLGYGSFWLGEGSPAQFIADELAWMPAHGHNGYLDLLNELGAIGLTLFLAALAWHLGCLIRLMRVDRLTAALHLAILILILSSNMTESDFLSGTLLQNILFLFSSAAVSTRLAYLRQWQADAAPSAQTAARVPA